jgi:hypothetical protein
MSRALVLRVRGALALAAALVLVGALAGPVAAEEHGTVFPAGVACADFDLAVDAGPQHGVASSNSWKVFYDDDGNVVRALFPGTGPELTLTNLTTEEALTLKSNASIISQVVEDDGTVTLTVLGHMVMIQFPTDFPPGPWTKLFVGRAVYSIDAQNVWTLLTSSGREVDICAALS